MSTDVNLLGKALIRLGILILLFIISPISLTIAFKAIKRYPEGFAHVLASLSLLLAGSLLIFTIYFAFKTFLKISEAIFKK